MWKHIGSTLFVFIFVCFTYQQSSAQENVGDGYAKISYTLWWGQDSQVDNVRVIYLRVPSNTTFYDVMEQAATRNSNYRFEATLNPLYGHYITSIAGQSEDTNTNHYWMIYVLPNKPDPNNPPGDELLSPVGVDTLRVANGLHYLFWLKTVNWELKK